MSIFSTVAPDLVGRGDSDKLESQREVTVAGNHFLHEESPNEIGAARADRITTAVRA